MARSVPPEGDTVTVPLHAEEASISIRETEGATIRVRVETHTRAVPIEQVLTHESVVIERVPVGRPVDSAPPVRVQGDTTIVSVVEEVVVVERRLMLTEEIHLRRARTEERHREQVTLRYQDAVIERTAAPQGRADSPEAKATTPIKEQKND